MFSVAICSGIGQCTGTGEYSHEESVVSQPLTSNQQARAFEFSLTVHNMRGEDVKYTSYAYPSCQKQLKKCETHVQKSFSYLKNIWIVLTEALPEWILDLVTAYIFTSHHEN